MKLRTILLSLVVPALAVGACADTVKTAAETTTSMPPPEDDGPPPPPDDDGPPPPPKECPGPEVNNPTGFTSCPSYICGGGARCLPKDVLIGLAGPEIVPSLDLLASCNDTDLCVPDIMIATNGNFLLETCDAVLGLEGRCISDCVPQVRDRAESLTKSTCAEFELCAPCYDPLTGDDTGVCNLTCDVGPADPPPPELERCCGDDSGLCIGQEALPQEALDGLTRKGCSDPNAMCVPEEMTDPIWEGEPCSPGPLLVVLGIDDGACLPNCLDAVDAFGVVQSDCPNGYKCAPCNALGENTGACGDPPW